MCKLRVPQECEDRLITDNSYYSLNFWLKEKKHNFNWYKKIYNKIKYVNTLFLQSFIQLQTEGNLAKSYLMLLTKNRE